MGIPQISRVVVLWCAVMAQAALCADEPVDATPGEPGVEVTQPKPEPTAVEPDKKPDESPVPEVITFPIPKVTEPPPPLKPAHIALLLPLKSATFGRAAEAVKEGFMAAAQLAGAANTLPIEVYDSEVNTQNLLPTYSRILTDNASIVVGPMTRSEVAAVARSGLVIVPTLALNLPDHDTPVPPQFYSLNLSQEAEARQMAHIAFGKGLRRAATIVNESVLSKRIQAAFAAEWLKLGATTTLEYTFSPDTKSLSEFRNAVKAQLVDVVFVAADANVARKMRPYVRANLALFATSQVFRSKNDSVNNMELRGLQFVDMPWLLKPDHPAVMVYPQSKKSLNAELQRFYALGIDAFRVAQVLLRSDTPPREPIDGVTGRITLIGNHLFSRELLQASFDQTGAVKALAP